jgi:hypothetical protein
VPGDKSLRPIFCTGIHKFPQRFGEITLANISCSSYYARQIDREEKLRESIQRGSEGKTESASTGLNWEESSAI